VTKGSRVEFAVRRDDLTLRPPQGFASTPDRGAIACKILAIEYQGYFVKVMLEAAGQTEMVAYVPERVFFDTPFVAGDRVLATWPVVRARALI
jgi:putative spermidine/putrescine transport system ATP-binding protein